MQYVNQVVNLFGGEDKVVLFGVLACLSLLLLVFCCKLVVALATLFVGWRKGIAERKKRRAAQGRRLQYTLPDKENAYVRARLNSALKADEKELFDEEKVNVVLRLNYTKTMLSKVRLAALSPIERLDVEEMAGAIALYAHKESWSSGDVKAVNEIFSRLLKLSAKYEIAV